MDILLIIVLIVLGGFALHGYLRGLVRIVFSLAAIFIAALIASCIAPYIAVFLQTQTPLQNVIREQCMEIIQQKAEDEMQKKVEEQEETIFGIKISKDTQEFLFGTLADKADEFMEESGIYEHLANQLAEIIIQRIAWILSFIVVGILFCVLIHFLDIITKLPVLNSINHMGGLVAGLLEGVVVVWILFFVIALSQGSEFGNQMMESIHENAFLRFLYDNNMIEKMIMSILRMA